MTYECLMDKIETIGARFESLVQLPEKRDPDWPKWSAAATVKGVRVIGNGDNDLAALSNLFENLQK